MALAPIISKQVALHNYLPQAIEEQWTAGKLAEQAGVHYSTANAYLKRVAAKGEKKALNKVLGIADEYRSTLECTAARSREFLESIEDKSLGELTPNERQLWREALA
jgi:predicted DNA binding protein